MTKKKIIMGTRGSKLSLAQTELIKRKLKKIMPDVQIKTKIIKTTGDKNMNPIPLDTVGKGWFTKEIDKELLSGEIDLAVHSLKDLAEELPEGLTIAAIPEREDAREAFISKKNVRFESMQKGAVIGTDSTRRKAQILHKRPDMVIKSIRGNVNTRLGKLDKGNEYDGIFLAVAGLKRLGFENRITQYFDETNFIPSPGQGALAITIKKKNKTMFDKLQKLNHQKTAIAVKAERTFSQVLGGGCKMPIGAYAEITDSKICLHGFVGSLDGKHIFKESLQGNGTPKKLGEELANRFFDKGISEFEKPKFVVITRPQNASIKMQKQIEELGFLTYFYPSISIAKSKLSKKSISELSDIKSYDWIIFTSQNGVRFFLTALNELGISLSKLKNKKIAVVGKKTAEAVEKYGLQVDFVPSKFTTEALANELKNIEGKRILMARANLATPLLNKKLQEMGAIINDIPIYKTSFIENDNPEFENLLDNQQIHCLTFTSPSTVTGFMNNIKHSPFKDKIFSHLVFSIGPVTTKALKKNGFKNIITADTYTINGMIAKMKENIL